MDCFECGPLVNGSNRKNRNTRSETVQPFTVLLYPPKILQAMTEDRYRASTYRN